MPLHIIGAGLFRTGTSSLKAAIEQVDLGPCYHIEDCLQYREPQAWLAIQDAVRAGKSHGELKHMFDAIWQKPDRTYRAASDCPSQLFYKQLADVYPEAKVVRNLLLQGTHFHMSSLHLRSPDGWAPTMA